MCREKDFTNYFIKIPFPGLKGVSEGFTYIRVTCFIVCGSCFKEVLIPYILSLLGPFYSVQWNLMPGFPVFWYEIDLKSGTVTRTAQHFASCTSFLAFTPGRKQIRYGLAHISLCWVNKQFSVNHGPTTFQLDLLLTRIAHTMIVASLRKVVHVWRYLLSQQILEGWAEQTLNSENKWFGKSIMEDYGVGEERKNKETWIEMS